MLSASSARQMIQSPRACCALRWPGVQPLTIQSHDFRYVRHKSPSKTKTHLPGSRRWVGYNPVWKGFYKAAFTHTRHSGPRRHFLTTTGSVRWSEAVHGKLEYLTSLDVTNHLFVFDYHYFRWLRTRIWLPPELSLAKNSLRRLNRQLSTGCDPLRKRLK